MRHRMYEPKHRPLAPKEIFFARLARHIVVAGFVIAASLAIGTIGYHSLDQLAWVDAFLNASMILGGMGPVDPLHSTPAKLFAAAYALYAGFVLLICVSIIIAPVFHRLLHRFHLESKAEEREG